MKCLTHVLAILLVLLAHATHAVTCVNSLPASNPDTAYTVHGDGTVTDSRTGLMWKVCAEGQTWTAGACTGSAVEYPWGNALSLAEGMEYAGHGDWRLPNLKELRSLVEECRINPSINEVVFPNVPSYPFWTSSPDATTSNGAWAVYFNFGYTSWGQRVNINRVRLVRGGPSSGALPSFSLIQGKVLDRATGAPLAGASVSLGAAGSYSTDSNGRYATNTLSPGSYTLNFSKAGYSPSSATVTTTAGQTLTHYAQLSALSTPPTGRPAIVSVTSPYSNGETYYVLPGVSFPVPFTATVDWNGKTPDKVRFIKSGGSVDVATTTGTATSTINVGNEASCSTLRAIAIATDGSESPVALADYLVTKPLPVDPAFPGLTNNLSVTQIRSSAGESFEYHNNSTLTKPVIEQALGVFGTDVPVFGNGASALDFIPELDFTFQGRDGSAEYQLAVMKDADFLKVEEAYSARHKPNGLKELRRLIETGIKTGKLDKRHFPTTHIAGFEAHVYPVFGVAATFDPASCEGTGGGWSSVSGSGGVAGAAEWSYTYQSLYVLPTPIPLPIPYFAKGAAGVEFDALATIDSLAPLSLSGDLSTSPYLSGTLGVGVSNGVALEGTLKGTVHLDMHLPPDASGNAISRCSADIGLTGRAYFLSFEYAFPSRIWELLDCSGRSGIASSWGTGLPATGKALSQDGGFQLISREYLKSKPGVSPMSRQLTLTAPNDLSYTVTSGPIHSATFPVSGAHLSSSGSQVNLLWLKDNEARSAINRTMLVRSTYDGTSWSPAAPVDDDGTADFNPAGLSFPDGTQIAAWEDMQAALPDAAAPADMLAQSEIAVAVFNAGTSTWSTATRLTSNAMLDHSPRLAGKTASDVMLTWVANAQNDLAGSSTAPNVVYFSKWNGSAWSAPAVAASVPNPIKRYNLIYDGSTAHLVFALDTNDDLGTLGDLELYRLTYSAGSWGVLTRLTTDTAIDDNPQLALDAGDNVLLTWVRGNELSSVTNFAMGSRSVIRGDDSYSSTLADYRVATAANGTIAVVYADRNDTNTADLYAVIYDPSFQLWGAPKQLSSDPETEQWPALTFLGNDTLVATYNRKLMINPDGTPTTGALTDLYMLKHTLGNDLGLVAGSLAISPENAGSGAAVTVSTQLRNTGDLVIENIDVTFYNGDPASGGTAIGTTTVAGPLKAGDVATASLAWVLPATTHPLTLYAVADPASAIDSLNRGDNLLNLVVALPDLSVTAVTAERIGVLGHLIKVTVANLGGTDSPPSTVSLRQGSATGTILATLAVPALTPQSSIELPHEWNTSGLTGTSVTIVAVVDEADTLVEGNEANNGLTVQISLHAGFMPTYVGFANVASQVSEGAVSVMEVAVDRVGSTTGTATVNFATSNGSALAGSDYTATSGTLSFGPGETRKGIFVQILSDGVPEGGETFSITLSTPSAGASLGTSLHTITINDDDTVAGGYFVFAAPTYSVRENVTAVTVYVTRLAGTAGEASVTVSTTPGTALAGSDFVGTSTRLTWANGEAGSKSVSIPIMNDAVPEAREAFTVSLGAVSGAGIGEPASATVTIFDDDRKLSPGLLMFVLD
jgi:hypothetical protein